MGTLLPLGCGHPTKSAPFQDLDTKVCAVVASPKTFHGKLVRFRARFESDGEHYSRLTDFPCHYDGLAPYDTERFSGPRKDRFDQAIYSPEMDAREVSLSATFTGVVRWRDPALQGPPPWHEWVLPEPQLAIDLTDVTEIRMTKMSK
jgi:hypothetical protein